MNSSYCYGWSKKVLVYFPKDNTFNPKLYMQRINQSKSMVTKHYNSISWRDQKQTKATKHNITQNMFKVKEGGNGDEILINYLKHSLNVK